MPGPQPLPPEQRRRHRLGVWLSDLDLAALEKLAGIEGIADRIASADGDAKKGALVKRAADYLRARALHQPVQLAVPAVNRQAYAELARLAGNINRLLTLLNRDALADTVDAGSVAVARDALDELRAVRRALIGLDRPEAAAAESAANAESADLLVDGAADDGDHWAVQLDDPVDHGNPFSVTF